VRLTSIVVTPLDPPPESDPGAPKVHAVNPAALDAKAAASKNRTYRIPRR
jgi:hypothetical protein